MICEKCWRDAAARVMHMGGDQAIRYAEIIRERNTNPCTLEEQCGDLHVVTDWADGTRRCRCGKVVEREPQRAEKQSNE